MLSDTRKCPHCAETVHVKAKVCCYCWYDFRKDPTNPPQYGVQNGFVVIVLVILLIFILATFAISNSQNKPEVATSATEIAPKG